MFLQRFKREYRKARKRYEFDAETLEYVFDARSSARGSHRPSVSIATACVAIIGAASPSATWDPTFCSSIGSDLLRGFATLSDLDRMVGAMLGLAR